MLKKKTPLLLCAVLLSFISQAQNSYSNFSQQTTRIQALAKNYSQLASVRSLTKTASGKDIWQITIGTGNTSSKPAIVIVGGTEGNYLLGTELAIGFAENILQGSNTDSIKTLLNKTSFYIFPNMSPDAMEQYFAKVKYERQSNATSTDDDRDGKLNEDPFDDLDNNQQITWMRVESPIGDYKLHPDDARVLVKADISKGEKGKYFLYTSYSSITSVRLSGMSSPETFRKKFSIENTSGDQTAWARSFAINFLKNRPALCVGNTMHAFPNPCGK